MDSREFSFEALEVYQKSRVLVSDIYRSLRCFPQDERYGLCDQLRRASTSITANIAEGSGRQSLKEKIHFIEISYGSLMEVFCKLQAATDLQYITESKLDEMRQQITDIAKMLSGLRTSFINRIQ